ncbi:hypothetical protein ACIQM4_15985 [Streptomyces sp. NPDC091272]|uniref:hypothetical protein n=1 Tax=Streptomyces sp. NPDC091272 TaxID=3365981 RepID=UPI00380B83FE
MGERFLVICTAAPGLLILITESLRAHRSGEGTTVDIGDLVTLHGDIRLVVARDTAGLLLLVRGDGDELWMGKRLPPGAERIPGEITEIDPGEVRSGTWVLLDGTWRRVVHVARHPYHHGGSPELFLLRAGPVPLRHVMAGPLTGCRGQAPNFRPHNRTSIQAPDSREADTW